MLVVMCGPCVCVDSIHPNLNHDLWDLLPGTETGAREETRNDNHA